MADYIINSRYLQGFRQLQYKVEPIKTPWYFWVAVSLLLITLSYLPVYLFSLRHLVASKQWHVDIGVLMYDLSLAFLMGIFIYGLTVWVPYKKNSRIHKAKAYHNAKQIVVCFYDNLPKIEDTLGFKLNLREINHETHNRFLAAIRDTDTLLSFNHKLNEMSKVMYMRGNAVRKLIAHYPHHPFYLDSDLFLTQELFKCAEAIKLNPQWKGYTDFDFFVNLFWLIEHFEDYIWHFGEIKGSNIYPKLARIYQKED